MVMVISENVVSVLMLISFVNIFSGMNVVIIVKMMLII